MHLVPFYLFSFSPRIWDPVKDLIDPKYTIVCTRMVADELSPTIKAFIEGIIFCHLQEMSFSASWKDVGFGQKLIARPVSLPLAKCSCNSNKK